MDLWAQNSVPCVSSPYTPLSPRSVFTGDRYWLFREANLEPGYPQPLTSYGLGIPYDHIDTAIWWEPTGHTFFFQEDRWAPLPLKGEVLSRAPCPQACPERTHSPWGWASARAGSQPGAFGHRYWRFNEETQRGDPGYPKPISVWQGIPTSPKGAFLSNDAGTRASPCTLPSSHMPPPHAGDRAYPRSPGGVMAHMGDTAVTGPGLGALRASPPGLPCIGTIPFLQTAPLKQKA